MIFTLSIYSFPANRGYSEKPEVNRLNSITIRRGEVDILGNKLVRKSLGCIPPFELHSRLQQFIFLWLRGRARGQEPISGKQAGCMNCPIRAEVGGLFRCHGVKVRCWSTLCRVSGVTVLPFVISAGCTLHGKVSVRSWSHAMVMLWEEARDGTESGGGLKESGPSQLRGTTA